MRHLGKQKLKYEKCWLMLKIIQNFIFIAIFLIEREYILSRLR